MKKVRLILSASMITLMGISAVTFSSCTKSSEDCAVGYTGKNCDVEIRTPMLGTYNATDINDANSSDVQTYNPVITVNNSVSVVNISNFGNFFSGPDEIVTSNVKEDGDNISFTIPNQAFTVATPAQGGGTVNRHYSVSGSGEYNSQSKKININYGLMDVDSNKIYNYTGTWNQQ